MLSELQTDSTDKRSERSERSERLERLERLERWGGGGCRLAVTVDGNGDGSCNAKNAKQIGSEGGFGSDV